MATSLEEKHQESPINLDGDDAGNKKSVESPWWPVWGGFLVFFVIWGLPISYGAFQEYYTLDFLRDHPSSTISWIGTVQGALLILVGLVSGPLYDLGYWRVLYALGSFLCVFGLMMLSISKEYYQVGLCIGIGCGLLYVPILTMIGAAFDLRRRALAMGMITSGIAFGGILYTIIYLRLLPMIGFGWMVRVIGFVSLAAFLAGAPTLNLQRPRTKGAARRLFDKAVLTDVPFLVFTLVQFVVFLGYLVPLFYVPTFAEISLGTDQSTGLYILIGSQGASLFGRLCATFLVKYLGVMLPWFACCSISGVLCLVWIVIHDVPEFVAFAVLYGFFSGALVALPPALFPTVCPDPTKLGSRLGISWTSSAIAFLIGTPIAGAVSHVQSGDFLGAQAWSGAMLLFSGVWLIGLWVLLARKHGSVFI